MIKIRLDEILAAKIREKCSEKSIPLREISCLVGKKSPSWFGDILSGRLCIKSDCLKEILDYLGIDVNFYMDDSNLDVQLLEGGSDKPEQEPEPEPTEPEPEPEDQQVSFRSQIACVVPVGLRNDFSKKVKEKGCLVRKAVEEALGLWTYESIKIEPTVQDAIRVLFKEAIKTSSIESDVIQIRSSLIQTQDNFSKRIQSVGSEIEHLVAKEVKKIRDDVKLEIDLLKEDLKKSVVSEIAKTRKEIMEYVELIDSNTVERVKNRLISALTNGTK